MISGAARKGLTPIQLLEMPLWMYNAYSEGFLLKQKDELALQIQSAYMGAYWNSALKHKKSLQDVIDKIYRDKRKIDRKPIDVKALEKEFKTMEDIRNNGWTK